MAPASVCRERGVAWEHQAGPIHWCCVFGSAPPGSHTLEEAPSCHYLLSVFSKSTGVSCWRGWQIQLLRQLSAQSWETGEMPLSGGEQPCREGGGWGSCGPAPLANHFQETGSVAELGSQGPVSCRSAHTWWKSTPRPPRLPAEQIEACTGSHCSILKAPRSTH